MSQDQLCNSRTHILSDQILHISWKSAAKLKLSSLAAGKDPSCSANDYTLFRSFKGFSKAFYIPVTEKSYYTCNIDLNIWQEPFGNYQNMFFPGTLKSSVYHLVKLLKKKRQSIVSSLYSTNGFGLNVFQATGAPMRLVV